MFSRGGGQAEFVEEAGFTHIGLIQVPPEGGIASMVRHAEHHAFHLAVYNCRGRVRVLPDAG